MSAFSDEMKCLKCKAKPITESGFGLCESCEEEYKSVIEIMLLVNENTTMLMTKESMQELVEKVIWPLLPQDKRTIIVEDAIDKCKKEAHHLLNEEPEGLTP